MWLCAVKVVPRLVWRPVALQSVRETFEEATFRLLQPRGGRCGARKRRSRRGRFRRRRFRHGKPGRDNTRRKDGLTGTIRERHGPFLSRMLGFMAERTGRVKTNRDGCGGAALFPAAGREGIVLPVFPS
ncbi:hypothetical protein KL86PLE_60427 [uncultured Pleomorphomonas sp.]|uniref:Uncharacterized protein n=1 Tax=uncultured Pleomorphomonas sp. TaxID=442121 RepID=A0A212LKN3_9HYPH|nr:hypothetical protein KL86PLE_60427 [uncultured Pleomorphomonas sp.]